MTKTVEEVRRAAFEAVAPKLIGASFLAEYDLYRNELGEYHYNSAAYYWKSFNAGLDAVEIQLPSDASIHPVESPHAVLHDCRAAIDQTGLGLKIK